ncbi:MAG: hypothetical protein JJU41_01110 [Bacteroidetes bacterium]|nr:hypothetical protein [Bacteroidota bacterium]MCH8522984.1 hypothetical protein [Balneolales bacterium]
MEKNNLNTGEFVETPLGVFTVNGNWFYTNSDEIQKFAPGLLTRVEFSELIRDAEVWVRSSDAMTIIFFMAILLLMPGYSAALLAVAFLLLWHLAKSAFVSAGATKFIRALTWDPLVILLAVASISYMGIEEQYTDVVYGLLFFILFRFGWLRKMFDSFYERYSKQISLNDRVLKMVVIKSAMSNNINVPELQRMESRIKELMRKRRGVRKR